MLSRLSSTWHVLRMVRGWHYTKLSQSSALLLSFSGMCALCILLLFFYFTSFLLHFHAPLSLELLVDVPLIVPCPADHVPDWQPCILLGMVEARSVNVKNTTTFDCSGGLLAAFRFFSTNNNNTRSSDYFCLYLDNVFLHAIIISDI